jgi:hypothetical protein
LPLRSCISRYESIIEIVEKQKLRLMKTLCPITAWAYESVFSRANTLHLQALMATGEYSKIPVIEPINIEITDRFQNPSLCSLSVQAHGGIIPFKLGLNETD